MTLVLLLAIGQLLDGLTLAYVAHNEPWLLAWEQNSITGALLAAGGVALVLAVKAALVTGVLAAHRLGAGRHGIRWRVLIVLVAASGFIGAAGNLWSVTHA